jgi:outer membrane lipoprotein SlyB
MRIRLSPIAIAGVLAASLAACTYNNPNPYPVAAYPGAAPGSYPVAVAPTGVEYGRVTNIQAFQGTAAASPGAGALVGAVAGALVGNVVGRSLGGVSARDTSTVLGGVGGALLGNQVARERAAPGAPFYRVTVQGDQGVVRYFDVPSPGDLRVGDRVRVDQGVIYHY